MLQYALEPHFDVEVESDPVSAAKKLATMKYAVLLTDQRMPSMTGVELCAHARAVSPDTVRIMISGYSDAHSTIDAVNRGAVSRYVQKPVREPELVEVVRTAINMLHAKRAVAELESQMVRGASSEALTQQEARIAGRLRAPLDSAKHAHQHLRDLSVAIRDSGAPSQLVDALTDSAEDLGDSLARIDAEVAKLGGTSNVEEERADLHRVLRSMLRVSGAPAGQGQEPPLWVAMSPVGLGQVLGAVYRRALRVSLTSSAEVSILLEDDRVAVRVSDDGPELSDEQLEALFDARLEPLPGDDGRTMALAAERLRNAGGECVSLRDGARTAVIIQLPRATPPTTP